MTGFRRKRIPVWVFCSLKASGIRGLSATNTLHPRYRQRCLSLGRDGEGIVPILFRIVVDSE